MEGTMQLEGNLNFANGGNNVAGSSSFVASATQGQVVDDEDGRPDGDPRHWDPPPDCENMKDASKSGLESVKDDLEKMIEVKALKPWNHLFVNKPMGKLSFPSMEDISDKKKGKFAIAVPDMVIDHSISLMAFSLVRKFVGPWPNIEDVRSFVKRKWRLKGQKKSRASKDDHLMANAHISNSHVDFESDDDLSNVPLHKKGRVDDVDKEDTDVEAGMEEEQGKEVDYEAESEKKEDAGDEEEDEEVETSEAEDEIKMQDWSEKDLVKGDLKHLEDVIRIVKDKAEVENEVIINRVAKTKKALKNFMNHSLEVLRVSSQNMNALVDCPERNQQNKETVIIDDMPTSNSAPQTSRHRTRQMTCDLKIKTKDIHLKQEDKDLREVAKAMMMLVKDAKESIKVFI
ncbi:chromatin modification-related protein EAF7-like [Cryptomeria japonica]|uniref:chromatin modification-related protein EAF7-like n=1 Tax=Cryptomeria japonica TaxID=3369 RepID=UPI0027DA15AC|nr:chromatin modification-related protein EAF7-like [Cryptomeria japonica]